jgi:hypothetical protein
MILRAALGMLFCLLLALPARADSQAAVAVYGVNVDVTAGDAETARQQAVLAGQRAGLGQLLSKLAPAADVARLAPLSDAQITDLVADYAVESEKVSTVRYVGVMTFRYRADGLGAYLQQNGVAFQAVAGPTVLVLPVLTRGGKHLLFEDTNDWQAAWAQHRPADGLVKLVTAAGDAADVAAITPDEAIAGDVAKLQALAAHYGAGEVLVAEAQPDPAGVQISVKRYGAAGALGGFDDKLAGDPESAYQAAIDRIAGQAQQDWIDQNHVASSVEQRLTVDAAVGSLGQWAEMNRRLGAVGTLRHVDLIYLMRGRAELDLVFIGDRDQLARALGQQALLLQSSADGRTTLSLAGGIQP